MSYIRGQGRGRGASILHNGEELHMLPGKVQSAASAEERFKAASRVHSKAVDKHLKAQTRRPPADQETDANDEMLRKVTASYNTQNGSTGNGDAMDTHSLLDMVMNEDTNICLVCLDSIGRTEQIWSCGSCHCIIHLACIQQWINEGSYQQQSSTLSEQHFPNKKVPWHCPKCRTEFSHNEFPSTYKCFCGKRTNPVDDPWLLPHSCGDTCDRGLKPKCGHQCLLLCHPGPCPPCPKSVRVSCHCGSSAPISRRCGSKSWSCGKPCRKVLECGAHQCEQNCHRGECKPCTETSIQSCSCGREKQNRPCAQPNWSCDQKCGKLYPCGHHSCEKVCHKKGECGECLRSQANRLCPCGKTSTHNLPCTVDVPCCGDTCGKPLSCGQHGCTEKCHYDSCSQCLQFSVKSCRCGAKRKEMPCVKSFTCEVRCQKMKSCNRHMCKRRCCDGVACSTCDQVCGKKLKCGNHKCTSPCHDGPCYPCTVTVDKACYCGKTVVSFPCIRQKTAQPPRCRRSCANKSKCDHPAIQKHACHFGNCPPCNLVCGKKLSSCEHTCTSRCHDSVNVKVTTEKRVLAGPWEQQTPNYNTLVRQECPPCPHPTPVTCKGEHETSTLPCSNSGVYSCNRECGRLLSCTNHTCTMECHTVSGGSSQHGTKLAGANCEVCEEECSKPRPEGCTHSCLKPCHPGTCSRCQQGVKTRCFCAVTVLYIPCHEWTSPSLDKETRLRCPGLCPKELACGHPCSLQCHPSGQCKDKCTKKITLRCRCKAIKQTVPCHLASEKVVDCTEKCHQQSAAPTTDTDLGSQSEAHEEELDSAVLLPGRRKRKRKERRVSESTEQSSLPARLARKYAASIIIVLAVVASFYFAITAEN